MKVPQKSEARVSGLVGAVAVGMMGGDACVALVSLRILAFVGTLASPIAGSIPIYLINLAVTS